MLKEAIQSTKASSNDNDFICTLIRESGVDLIPYYCALGHVDIKLCSSIDSIKEIISSFVVRIKWQPSDIAWVFSPTSRENSQLNCNNVLDKDWLRTGAIKFHIWWVVGVIRPSLQKILHGPIGQHVHSSWHACDPIFHVWVDCCVLEKCNIF